MFDYMGWGNKPRNAFFQEEAEAFLAEYRKGGWDCTYAAGTAVFAEEIQKRTKRRVFYWRNTSASIIALREYCMRIGYRNQKEVEAAFDGMEVCFEWFSYPNHYYAVAFESDVLRRFAGGVPRERRYCVGCHRKIRHTTEGREAFQVEGWHGSPHFLAKSIKLRLITQLDGHPLFFCSHACKKANVHKVERLQQWLVQSRKLVSQCRQAAKKVLSNRQPVSESLLEDFQLPAILHDFSPPSCLTLWMEELRQMQQTRPATPETNSCESSQCNSK